MTSRGRALWALTFLLPVVSACSGAAIPDTTNPTLPSLTKPPVSTPPAATMPPPPTPRPCYTRAELAAMALDEIAAQPSLCFDSEDGVHTEIAQAEAIETVRAFLQDPDRRVGFREVTFMGNSPSGVLRVARLEDDQGASYLVAVVAEKVLEMDPSPAPPQAAGPALSQEELQAIAEELILREFPDFERLRDNLKFEAGQKSGGLAFFRWEQPGLFEPGAMPPLAQVGITESGEIFSYINTLFFLR